MPFVDIPNSELQSGATSRQAHFRIIRDNTSRFDIFQPVTISAPATTLKRWGLSRIVNRTEEVGRGSRRYGFFGPRDPIFGTVSRYVWRDQHIAYYHATFSPTLPPDVRLFNVEVVGAQISRDGDSDWILNDTDTCIIGPTIHFFASAVIEGERQVDGEGRQIGANRQPSIPANYPGGINNVPEPPSSIPKYSVTARVIGVRDGGLIT